MSLKQSIVIKSEYTNNARSQPGKGSRGASPGQYVMRYMAREDATEVLTPIQLTGYDSAEFTRYMARSDATEKLKSKEDESLNDADAYGSPLVLKHKFRQIDKLAGRAFGSRGISLSQEDLEESSHLIQEAFDDGHSVQKIILSFTEEYLRETGVLNPKFKHKGRGSYKGHIDQLKLREAITAGVNNMTKAGKFVNPEWVGTIQIDTSHVHAHIALTDKEFSEFRMRDDGADRGKINEREKKMFRKGINFSLQDMKALKSFHQQSSLERRNVVSYVKDYAYSTLHDNTTVQLLIASLPKERQHWRYGTNRTSMKHANELAVGIVERVFHSEPDKSGYNQAMRSVRAYADESARKNKLNLDKKQDLIVEGRERIIERSVNGLYKTLKEIDPNMLHIRTAMTDIQSSSDEELAQALKPPEQSGDFDPAAFTLRVRGYNKRQEIHTKESRTYYELGVDYDTAYDKGQVDDTAHVMRSFYNEEQRYHMGLTDKYRTFMSFHGRKDRENIKAMLPVYKELSEQFQDIRLGEESIGLINHEAREAYKLELRDYTFDCFERGVATRKEWDSITEIDEATGKTDTLFVLPVRPKSRAENLNTNHFNQVKALDVHHLGLDYYNRPDARIDAVNATVFANAWQSRAEKAELAKIYTDSTGQQLPALDRAISDIQDMESVVGKAVKSGLIQTVTLEDLTPSEERQLFTIPLHHSVDVTKQVRQTLEHIEVVESMNEVDSIEATENVRIQETIGQFEPDELE